MAAAEAKTSLQLYNTFLQERSNLIFLMSRNCDAKLNGYMAQRKENSLIAGREVTCTSVICPDFQTDIPINPIVLDQFLGMTVKPVAGTKKYEAYLQAFPERRMILSLKRNSTSSSSDGRVVASMTLTLPNGNQVADVQLFCIHQTMTFDSIGIPDIKQLVIFGCVSPKNILPADLKYCITTDTKEHVIVQEVIHITEEVKARFPIDALAKEWLKACVGIGAKS